MTAQNQNSSSSNSNFISPQIEAALLSFLESLKSQNASSSTIRNYRSDIRQFYKHLTSYNLDEIFTKEKLSSFVTAQKEKGLKDSSVTRKIASINQFAIWANNQGLLRQDISWIDNASVESLLGVRNIQDHQIQVEEVTFTPTPAQIPTVQASPIAKPPQPATVQEIKPEFALPKVSLPRLPKLELPKLELPTLPSLPTPSLPSLPSLPKIKKHEIKPNKPELKLDLVDKLVADKKQTKSEPKSGFKNPFSRPASNFILPYLNLGLIVLFFIGLGFLGYNQLVKETPATLAFPTSPTRPNRTLSFQGRLTDTNQNPITSSTAMEFKIWDQLSGGTEGSCDGVDDCEYTTGSCNITPDQDGIFNVGIGDDCGSEINEEVFSENVDLWLEVEVGGETLAPRQPIRTVPYALNSETVQGYPISSTGAATVNTILTMDSSGFVTLGEIGPTLRSIAGTFTITGGTVSIESSGDLLFSDDNATDIPLTVADSSIDANLGQGIIDAINDLYGLNSFEQTDNLIYPIQYWSDELAIGGNSTSSADIWLGVDGSAIFNEQGNDADFNIEGTSDADLFFVDASTNRVGIGDNTPDHLFDVDGNIGLTNESYINWGDTDGTSGYGFRDSGGTIQFKNSAGTWTDIGIATNTYWQRTNGTLSPLSLTTDVNLGSTSTASAKVSLAGSLPRGMAVGIFNQTEATTQDILTASSAGVPRFTIANNGDVYLRNNEYISNLTDDFISFVGTGGTADTDITFDLDGTRPVISSTASTAIQINEDLYIGTNNHGFTDEVGQLRFNSDFRVDNSFSVGSVNPTGNAGELITDSHIIINDQGELQLREGSGGGTNYTGFRAPGTLAGDVIYTLPTADGGVGQVLRTDGSGNLEWSDGSNSSYWQLTDGSLSPISLTLGVNLGSTATASAKVSLAGSLPRGQAVGIFNQTESTAIDIFTASSAGVPRFTVRNNGEVALRNNEFISNVTDDLIFFQGSGGTSDTNIVFDLDGTLPVIYSDADTGIQINDDLYIGTNSRRFYDEAGQLRFSSDLEIDSSLGVGVASSGNAGELTTASHITINDQGELRLSEDAGSGSNYTGFRAPTTLAGNVLYTLPDADGGIGQVLSTNGTGTLSWTNAAAVSYWDINDGSLSPTYITTDINLGNVATDSAKVSLAGSLNRGKAVAILNQTEDQDVFSASASGSTLFTIQQDGDIDAEGSLDLAGDILLAADNYINWGTVIGDSGYGFRDNGGQIQFKHDGGSWQDIGTGGGGGGGDTLWDVTNGALHPLHLFATTNFGDAATDSAKVSIAGSFPKGQSALIINQTEDSAIDIFSASASGTTRLTLNNDGDLLPGTTAIQDIGSDTLRWQDLFLGTGNLHLGTSTTDEYTIAYDTGSNYLGFNVNGTGNPEIVFSELGKIGIGDITPEGQLDVEGAVVGQALFQLNETGNQDIIAASVSGQTSFRVSNVGYAHANRFVDLANSSYYLDPAATGTSLNVAGTIRSDDGLYTSGVADGASAVGFTFNTANNLTTDGALVAKFQNNGTDLVTIDKDGNLWVTGNIYADRGLGTAMKNTGPDLAQYDIVVINTTEDNSDGVPRMSATDSAFAKKGFGVVQETCTANSTCNVVYQGNTLVNVADSTNRGDYIFTSSTLGQATSLTSQHDGLVGIATSTDQSAPYLVQMTLHHQPAVSKLRVADKNRMHNDYLEAVQDYQPTSEANFYDNNENIRKGLFFDSFMDYMKIDSTNSDSIIDINRMRAGLAGGQEIDDNSTGPDGEFHLGDDSVNDIYYYDRNQTGDVNNHQDSTPQTLVDLGIDPYWYKGVSLVSSTVSGTIQETPRTNLSTYYNGGLIKAEGRYTSGQEDGGILITIKSDNEATDSANPSLTFDWRTTDDTFAPSHSDNDVLVTKGASTTLETGTTDITLTFSHAQYHPGDTFLVHSWYLEPETSGDRGGKQEFPERAYIVAGDDDLAIIDADTNNSWMKFTETTDGMIGAFDNNSQISSVHMVNGILYIGFDGTSSIGMVQVNFYADSAIRYNSTAGYRYLGIGIKDRNNDPGVNYNLGASNTLLAINDDQVNDVHANPIPNEPAGYKNYKGWGFLLGNNTTSISDQLVFPWEFDESPKLEMTSRGHAGNTTDPKELFDCISFATTFPSVAYADENSGYVGMTGQTYTTDYRFCYEFELEGHVTPHMVAGVGTDTGASLIHQSKGSVVDSGLTEPSEIAWVTGNGTFYYGQDTNNYIIANHLAGNPDQGQSTFSGNEWYGNLGLYATRDVNLFFGSGNDVDEFYVTEDTSQVTEGANTLFLGTTTGLTKVEEFYDGYINNGIPDRSKGSTKFYTNNFISEELLQRTAMYLPLNLDNSSYDFENVIYSVTNTTPVNMDSSDAVSGVRGTAADFNGTNERLSGGAASNFRLAGEGYASAWIRPDLPTSDAGPDAVFDFASCWSMFLGNPTAGNAGKAFVRNWDGTPDDVLFTVDYGQWQHVAMVHRDGRLYAYKNGELVGSIASGNNTCTLGSISLSIGSNSSATATSFYAGDIDEFVLGARAITHADVKRMYESGKRSLNAAHELDDYQNNFDNAGDGFGPVAQVTAIGAQPTFDNRNNLLYVSLNDGGSDGYTNVIDLNSDMIVQYLNSSTDPETLDNDIHALQTSKSGLEMVARSAAAYIPGFNSVKNNQTATYYSDTIALPENISNAYAWVSEYVDPDCSTCSIVVSASNNGGNSYVQGTKTVIDNNQDVPEQEYLFNFDGQGDELKFRVDLTRDSALSANVYIEKYGIAWFNDDDTAGDTSGLFTQSDTVADGDYLEIAHYQNTNDILSTGWIYDAELGIWKEVSLDQANGGSPDTSDTNLEAWWRAEESSGTLSDETSNSNDADNGNGFSAPTYQANGKKGKAVALDGEADYFSVADSASLSPTEAVTIGGWVNLEEGFTANSQGHDMGFIEKGDYALEFNHQTGKLDFKITTNEAQSDTFVYNGSLEEIFSATSLKDLIYLGRGDSTNAGDILHTDGSTGVAAYDDTTFERVSALIEYNGWICAGFGTGTGDGDVQCTDPSNSTIFQAFNDLGNQEMALSLAEFNGRLYAGQANNAGDGDIYVYDPSYAGANNAWSLFYDGSAAAIYDMVEYNDKLYVAQGGSAGQGDVLVFDEDGNVSTSYNGSTTYVLSLAVYDGELYAGLYDGATGGDVYVFDGSSWSLSYDGPSDGVYSLGVFQGKLYAGMGDDGAEGDVYVYDGSSWSLFDDHTAPIVQNIMEHKNNLYISYGDTAGSGDMYVRSPNRGLVTSSSKANWDANKWYHVVATYDSVSDIANIYIDGELDASPSASVMESTGINDSNSKLFLGSDGGSQTRGEQQGLLRGRFDEAFVYSDFMTASEAAYLATPQGAFRIEQVDENTVRLYNNSGVAQQLRLDLFTGNTNGSAGSAGQVRLAPISADVDAGADRSSIWINKTDESGRLLRLQNDGTDRFTVGWDGHATLSGSLTIGTASLKLADYGTYSEISTTSDDLRITSNASVSGTLAIGVMGSVDAGTCNTAAEGRMYYNKDDKAYYFCNAEDWVQIGPGQSNTSGFMSIHDPSSWTTSADTFPASLARSQTAVIGDYIYMFGGILGSPTDNIYRAPISDPTNWEDTGSNIPDALYFHRVLVIEDTIYLYGGYDAINNLANIYSAPVSDPTNWSDTGDDLPDGFSQHNMVVVGNTIYLYGGISESTTNDNTIYSAPVSDPTNFTDTTANMPVVIHHSQMAVIGDNIYFFGGRNSGLNPIDEIYSAPVSSPTTVTDTTELLPAERAYSHIALIGDFVYLFGGISPGPILHDTIYRAPVSDPTAWEDTGEVIPASFAFGSYFIAGDKIVIGNGTALYTGDITSVASDNVTVTDNQGDQIANSGKYRPNFSAALYSGADLAEYYPSNENLKAGQVVSWNENSGAYIKKSTKPYDSLVAGVISTQPGLVLGLEDTIINYNQSGYPLALSGRVPVLISNDSAPIKIGDYLTTSAQAGYATKATQSGTVVARALENWSPNNGKDKVLAFVTPGQFLADDQSFEPKLVDIFAESDQNNASGSASLLTRLSLLSNDNFGFILKPEFRASASATLLEAKDKFVAFGQTSRESVSARFINAFEGLNTASANIYGRLTAFSAQITDLVTSRVTTGELNVDLISPISEDGNITFRLGESASESGELSSIIIENASGSAVASIDSEGNIVANGNILTLGDLIADGSIQTSTISAQDATISGKLDATSARITALESKLAQFNEINAQTANIVNATISGTLFADNIDDFENKVSLAIEQPSLLDKIMGITSNNPNADAETDIDSFFANHATYSSDLESTGIVRQSLADLDLSEDDLVLNAEATFINRYLDVNGTAYIAENLGVGQNLIVADSLFFGTSEITSEVSGESITQTVGQIEYAPLGIEAPTFEIQPSGKGVLSIMAGLLTLDENGQAVINGDLTVAGDLKVEETLLTNLVKPNNFDSPLQVQLASRSGVLGAEDEVKESRFEILNELGVPVATISAQGKADFSSGIGVGSENLNVEDDETEIESDKSSGTALVKAGTDQITIKSKLITDDSLIYITPLGSTNNQVIYVKDKAIDNQETEDENEAGFTVGFDNTTDEDVRFNWWIVN